MFGFGKKDEGKNTDKKAPGTTPEDPLVFNLRFIDSPDGVFFIPGNLDNTGHPFRVRGGEGRWRVPTENSRSGERGFSFALPLSEAGTPDFNAFLNEVRSFTKKEVVSGLDDFVSEIRFGSVRYYFRYGIPEDVMAWAVMRKEYLEKNGKRP